MELRQVKYFVAVAETKSLKNAIERVHIAQPALSQSIKLLEDELGADLFTRSRKGMELTGAGRKFLVSARLILQEVARAKERVSEEQDNPIGTVNMALPPSVSRILSVPLFRAVKRTLPNVTLNIEEQTRIDVRQAFDTGVLDLVVYFAVEESEHLQTEPLVDEWMYLVTPYREGQDLPEEIESRKLSDYPLLFPPVISSAPRNVSVVAASLGIDVPIMKNRVPPMTVIELVRQGVTNSVTPWTLIHDAVDKKQVSAAKLIKPEVNRQIMLTYPTNRYMANATLAVMKLIRELTVTLHEEGIWRGTLRVSEDGSAPGDDE